MKNKKKIIVSIVILVFVVGFCLFAPRPLSGVLQNADNPVSQIACGVTFTYDEVQEDGTVKPCAEQYTLQSLSTGMEEFEQIMDGLDDWKYRPSVRNYLPFPITRVEADDDSADKMIMINMRWGNEAEEAAVLQLIDEKRAIFSVGDGEMKIYYLHNSAFPSEHLIHSLASYIKEHGTLTE